MKSESLDRADALSAATATGPRVSIEDITANIEEAYYLNAAAAVESTGVGLWDRDDDHPLDLLTLCILVTRSGFTVVGKSASASAENFSEENSKVFAYEDAVRQLWPFMGYALREKLSEAARG